MKQTLERSFNFLFSKRAAQPDSRGAFVVTAITDDKAAIQHAGIETMEKLRLGDDFVAAGNLSDLGDDMGFDAVRLEQFGEQIVDIIVGK